MSDLISQLPERVLETAVRHVGQLNAELKAAQRLTNEGGLIGYTIDTDNAWDRTETVTAADTTQLTFVVTFTTDQSQLISVAQLYLDIRANGTGDSNKFTYLNGTYAGTIFAGVFGWSDGTSFIYKGNESSTFGTDEHTWTIHFFYKGTITYYMKPTIRASCGGTVSIARTL